MTDAPWYFTQSVIQVKKRLASPPQVDAYGNDVYVTTQVQLDNVVHEPRKMSGLATMNRLENVDRRQHVTQVVDLFILDLTVDVQATDQFLVGGVLFEVTGSADLFDNSGTGLDFIQVLLVEVTG